jgi:caffeoyl-CoA O-methyltransferase
MRPVAPHGILVEKLGSLRRLAGGMALDPAFRQMIEEAERLAQGLEPYLEACTTPESAELRKLAIDTQREDWGRRFQVGDTSIELEGEMLSGHIEGQFLKTLVHAMKAARVLEIGLFTGYSALAMAEALPSNGMLLACERDPYAAAFARRAFDVSPHGSKIRIEIGDAAASLERLADRGEAFDLIFIDADKVNYPVYLNLVLASSLLGPHGLICVDNTLMQGQPYVACEPTDNGRAIAAFNRMVSDDPRIEQVMLPIRDGLTLVRRI